MIYREYRAGLRRSGKPILLPVEEIYDRMGFISVYGFDQDTKDIIDAQGGTYGLRGQNLYSNLLYIDIDDNDALAVVVRDTLLEMQVTFDMYHTGGRGWHFHIPIEPMSGPDVAYRQKRWVAHHFPGTDISLYKTSGIIRLPGTYHSGHPGNRKMLHRRNKANLLKIDLSDLPVTVGKWQVEESDYDTEAILDSLLMKEASLGGRNNAIYARAMLFAKLNEPLEDAVRVLTVYNDSLVHPPVSPNELMTTIKSAYRG
jgi:hypothetical protein